MMIMSKMLMHNNDDDDNNNEDQDGDEHLRQIRTTEIRKENHKTDESPLNLAVSSDDSSCCPHCYVLYSSASSWTH